MLLVRTCGYPSDRVGRHVRNKHPTQQEPPMSSEQFLLNVTAGLQRYLDEGQATAAAAVIAARSGKTLLPGLRPGSPEHAMQEDLPSDKVEMEEVAYAKSGGAAMTLGASSQGYGSDHNTAGMTTDTGGSGGRARRSVRARQNSAMYRDFVVGEDALPRSSSRESYSSDAETSSRQEARVLKRPKPPSSSYGRPGAGPRNAKYARLGNSVATVTTGPLKAAWGPMEQPRNRNAWGQTLPPALGYASSRVPLNPPPPPARRRGPRYVGRDEYEDEDEYEEVPIEASPLARRQATAEALIELQRRPASVDNTDYSEALAAKDQELAFLRQQNTAQAMRIMLLSQRVQELEAQLASAMVAHSNVSTGGVHAPSSGGRQVAVATS